MLGISLRKFTGIALGTVLVGMAAFAPATITFSNVTVTGSLVPLGNPGSWSFATGAQDIDFSFNHAIVGDVPSIALPPGTRSGTITITYIATSTLPMVSNSMLVSLLGGLSGSGTVFFNEVIETTDMVPVTIGSHGVVLTGSSALPYTHTINFSQEATQIKVKKTIILAAPESGADILDLASIGLVEQNIGVVPEPATMAVLALGAGALMARRRRRA